MDTKLINPFENNGKYVDSGWIDCTPVAASSNKNSANLGGYIARWGQWRLFPDGMVRFRGQISRNTGNWGAEYMFSIPAYLLRGIGFSFFPLSLPTDILLFFGDGQVQCLSGGSQTYFLDGIEFSADPR